MYLLSLPLVSECFIPRFNAFSANLSVFFFVSPTLSLIRVAPCFVTYITAPPNVRNIKMDSPTYPVCRPSLPLRFPSVVFPTVSELYPYIRCLECRRLPHYYSCVPEVISCSRHIDIHRPHKLYLVLIGGSNWFRPSIFSSRADAISIFVLTDVFHTPYPQVVGNPVGLPIYANINILSYSKKIS